MTTDNELQVRKVLGRRCSYDTLFGERLVGVGDLLQKYGQECFYSIRDKTYDVFEKDDTVNLLWVTQDTPIAPAENMLIEALNSVLPSGTKVELNICDRMKTEAISKTIIIK